MLRANRRSILACCIIAAVFTAVNARADFASSHNSSGLTNLERSNQSDVSFAGDRPNVEPERDSSWRLASVRLTPWATPAEQQQDPEAHPKAAAQRVITVPPGPSSTSLFFSALAGIGVWHISKNVRKLSISALPEWYQADGPTQVGCATPLDLDFSLSAMQVCIFEGPIKIAVDQDHGTILSKRFEPHVRIPREDFTPNADPRGPPACF